jgi:hypothetical protein
MLNGSKPATDIAAPDPTQLTGLLLGNWVMQAIKDGHLPDPDDLSDPQSGYTQREVAVAIARNLREAGTPRALVRFEMERMILNPSSALDSGRPWTIKDARAIVDPVFSGPAPDQMEYLEREPSRLQLMSLADAFVVAEEEVDWVVPDLIAAGEKGVIAGPPKEFKTWLSLHVARCVATSEAVLGEEAWGVAQPQPVLFVQEEGARQRWARRLTMVFEDAPSSPFFYTHRAGFSLIGRKGKPSQHVSWLIEKAKLVGARLIVIDPWQRVTPGVKANDAADTGPAWDAIHMIAHETGAAVFVIHHASKGGGPPTMDSIRGSSRMAGEVDLLMVVRKRKRGLLEVLLDGRDLVRTDDGGNLEISYKADRRHVMHARGFKVTLKPEKRSTRDAVIAAFEGVQPPITSADVRDAVNEALPKGRSRTAVDEELHVLVDEGKVEKLPSPKGKPTFWRWLDAGGATD